MKPFDLESELRAIRPAPPPPQLAAEIARDLAQPQHPTAGLLTRRPESTFDRILSGLCWACGGATVAIITTMGLHLWQADGKSPGRATETATAPTEEKYFEPAESSRQLLGAESGDLVYNSDQEPERIIRYSSRERHVWANPTTGARVEVEVPREDVVFVPVSFQ
jgi:hypothetical protein